MRSRGNQREVRGEVRRGGTKGLRRERRKMRNREKERKRQGKHRHPGA